jgi:hypothetical protein
VVPTPDCCGAEPNQLLWRSGSDNLTLKLRATSEGLKFEIQTRAHRPGSFIAKTTAGIRSILTIPRSIRRVRLLTTACRHRSPDPQLWQAVIHDDLPRIGAASGESEMKRTYSSFLIALTCLLIPGLIWVFATTQLFGLSITLRLSTS